MRPPLMIMVPLFSLGPPPMPADWPRPTAVSSPGFFASISVGALPAESFCPPMRVTSEPMRPLTGVTMLFDVSRLRTSSSMTSTDPQPQRMPGQPLLALTVDSRMLLVPLASVRCSMVLRRISSAVAALRWFSGAFPSLSAISFTLLTMLMGAEVVLWMVTPARVRSACTPASIWIV